MTENDAAENEVVLKILSGAAFLIMFNSFLFAPLIPSLAKEFDASENLLGLAVPAYLLPYGCSTLFYGPLSDRIGRKHIILILLGVAIFSTLLCGFVQSAQQLIGLRVVAGLCAGGIVPIALALIGDLFPFETRGNAMGWVFGAIAGGAAFGSTLGAALNPLIGWRREFYILAVANAGVFYFAYRHRETLGQSKTIGAPGFVDTLHGYVGLLKNRRALRTYLFIFLNGSIHSGVFSWLGLYLRGGMNSAILGLGWRFWVWIPGMLLGPTLGRIADRHGRSRLIPAGFFISAASVLLLAPVLPVYVAGFLVTSLSLGFDMTHPLMVGIVSTLSPERRGLAMGMNAFVLFVGLGLGALIFQLCMAGGITWALLGIRRGGLMLGVIALTAFASERPGLSEKVAA